MSRAVDGELLAERTATVLAHFDRVAAHLPADPADLRPMSSPTDTVVLHLWQAIQVVIDLATATCVRLGLGSPPTYGDAFRRLAEVGLLDPQLGTRLATGASTSSVSTPSLRSDPTTCAPSSPPSATRPHGRSNSRHSSRVHRPRSAPTSTASCCAGRRHDRHGPSQMSS